MIGHIDEIGVHVTHIEDSGFVRFGEVGGWDPIQLVGQRIVLTTRDGELRGVIGRKPIHLFRGDDATRRPRPRTCTSTSAPPTVTRRGRWSGSATSA